ncbi:MAG: DNA transposition protein [Magnetococcales bacterium]|nr:DNA transposition protein [Magnetococcales bacterium]
MARLILTTEDLNACFIPDSLQELVRVIGAAAALRLVETYGGLTLAIPKRLHESGELTMKLGVETVKLLISWGGGDRVYVPRAEKALRCLRDQEIRRRVDANEKPSFLALQYRLSERRVWAILKGEDPVSRQSAPRDPRQLAFRLEDGEWSA